MLHIQGAVDLVLAQVPRIPAMVAAVQAQQLAVVLEAADRVL
jgi:hypothetical protein